MSTFTADSYELTHVVQPPSLVFPSLHNNNNNNNQDDKNLQTCIHFASRLIKLRSELRSPSYMRQSMSYFDPKEEGFEQEEDFEQEETQNVSLLPRHHPYAHKLQNKNSTDDESEILSATSSSIPSQLTNLSNLVRKSNTSLALPTLHSSPLTKRSISLSNLIQETIDSAIKKQDHQQFSLSKRCSSSSLAFVSQLIYQESIIVPQPSKSMSTISSIDQDERPAVLVQLSPSAAKAANVAKSKRRLLLEQYTTTRKSYFSVANQ